MMKISTLDLRYSPSSDKPNEMNASLSSPFPAQVSQPYEPALRFCRRGSKKTQNPWQNLAIRVVDMFNGGM